MATSSPDACRVTWVGHAATRLDLGQVRVLADPLLTTRVAHLHRRHPVPGRTLHHVDLVVISHAHADHLHRGSLRRLAESSPGIPVVVPTNARRFVEGLGLGQVHEVSPGDRLTVAGVELTVTRAVHPGGRTKLVDPAMPAVGYVVEGAGRRCYFAGDTDLFDEMAALGPLDLACVPISGWWRSVSKGHLDPETAADAVRLIDPAAVLPIHWGTYAPGVSRRWPAWLSEPGRRFAAALARQRLSDRLVPLEPGGASDW
ncbi:L-ascorbate metabolism protein UlaG (beta-lactamase superfamily) [Nocardioides sp. BE266]|uniref:MBL fold metallo-hydrolase n=1 Tax=Nocardioides sp. BE266 TaxID=2817725 RepID=UPI00285861AA|nr:MBL fold metallo-hydrolase [Nocardioides sp. BE266]MDR7254358.1 L-ascorbate metabolism protein UlaG (beta-lactamase superfamily) [Nocardioides sp. BE266]